LLSPSVNVLGMIMPENDVYEEWPGV
jgi:hypothetical protein